MAFPSDPSVRKDGTCVVCARPRKFGRQPKVNPAEYLTDPFCSRPCCQLWYELESMTKVKITSSA